jgi:predicted amidohydrolase
MPGLVDIHAHVLLNGHDMGIHTDSRCSCSGVTTVCDAGSAGSSNFTALRHVLDNQCTRAVRPS